MPSQDGIYDFSSASCRWIVNIPGSIEFSKSQAYRVIARQARRSIFSGRGTKDGLLRVTLAMTIFDRLLL
jgi:hypothetical protein